MQVVYPGNQSLRVHNIDMTLIGVKIESKANCLLLFIHSAVNFFRLEKCWLFQSGQF